MKRCGVRYGNQRGRKLVCRRAAGHTGNHAIRLSVAELRRTIIRRK